MAKMEVKTSLLDNMIGVGDMVLLEPLTEESFINNLKKRFDHNEIYTYIGSVVVSVNPYRSLPIYSPEKVEDYRNRNFYELSPHMFADFVLGGSHLSPEEVSLHEELYGLGGAFLEEQLFNLRELPDRLPAH